MWGGVHAMTGEDDDTKKNTSSPFYHTFFVFSLHPRAAERFYSKVNLGRDDDVMVDDGTACVLH